MLDLTKAPSCGRILAYAPDALTYDAYTIADGRIILHDGSMFDLDGVYEVHCFDADKELRGICEAGEWRHCVLTASEEDVSEDDGFVYRETQCVQDRYCVDRPEEKLIVANRFAYDQNDCVYLKSYRLAME